jgi:hypothetical protein
VPEYEIIVIYEAGLSEEALEAQVESFKGFLAREGAELVLRWFPVRVKSAARSREEKATTAAAPTEAGGEGS